MKKVILATTIAFIGLATTFVACQKENSQVEESQNLAEKSFYNTVSDSIDNYTYINQVLEISNLQEAISLSDFLIQTLDFYGVPSNNFNLTDGIKFDIGQIGSVGYVFKNNSNQYLAIRENTDQTVEVVIGTLNYVNGIVESVSSQTYKIDLGTKTVNTTLGEKDLGPRRSGESYGDCFERNWDNFGTDIVSKLVQATNPWWVAAAISITCAHYEKAAATNK